MTDVLYQHFVMVEIFLNSQRTWKISLKTSFLISAVECKTYMSQLSSFLRNFDGLVSSSKQPTNLYQCRCYRNDGYFDHVEFDALHQNMHTAGTVHLAVDGIVTGPRNVLQLIVVIDFVETATLELKKQE